MSCRNAKPKETAYKLTDGEGLYLMVNPNGSRLWRLAYRFGGKQKTLAIGAYPVITLAAAREKRLDAKRLLAAGRDPSIEKQAKTLRSRTFESFARRWHDKEKSEWVEAHAFRVLNRLERDVFPVIGQRAIDDIEPPDVLTLLRTVEERGALDISKRLRQSISAVFRFAIAEGRAKHNPAADLTDALKPKPKVQHFAKIRDTEIPDFMRKIAAYDGSEQTRLAILFTLHTFVRTSEVRFAEWSEFEGDLWRIPAERMKMGREHIVPLSRQAADLLPRIREHAGESRYLFPSRGKNGVMSENTMLFALYRMGYHSRLTVHGFRGMASTILNEHGFNRDHIERQLAHVEGNDVRGAYNSAEWLPGRREIMQWWSDYLDAAAPPTG